MFYKVENVKGTYVDVAQAKCNYYNLGELEGVTYSYDKWDCLVSNSNIKLDKTGTKTSTEIRDFHLMFKDSLCTYTVAVFTCVEGNMWITAADTERLC